MQESFERQDQAKYSSVVKNCVEHNVFQIQSK